MKTVFSEEKGLVPDSQTLSEFLHENKIEPDNVYPQIRIDKDDWISNFYKATNGKFYEEVNSCGYEIHLYEFESEEEYQICLRTCLFVNCDIKFLSNNNPT
jgi:hypothetical protein